MAVALLDLDGFKEINDRLGHHVGDRVLQEVAAALAGQQGPTDLVARLGGDEFAALLGAVESVDDARRRVRRMLEALEEPLEVDGFQLTVRGSFGIAVFPDHADTAEELMERADLAMYQAKRGRHGVLLYPAHTETGTRGRLTLLAELRHALDREELVLHYQPKVALGSGHVVGVEALVRWNHPKLGMIPPRDFIPAAEQTDLMGPFTALVLERALTQARAWSDAGLFLPVAVNGSARNLHDLRFPTVVQDLLHAANVPAHQLELEVTENTVMTDPERATEVLAQLRELGMSIAIDDFGTGYSSLATLRDLPVDVLKIDRTFVMQMGSRRSDAVIVRSIIDLARNLGLGTVAEGIENEHVLSLLQEYGCTVAQGFYLARPVPAAEIPALIAARERPDVTAAERFGSGWAEMLDPTVRS